MSKRMLLLLAVLVAFAAPVGVSADTASAAKKSRLKAFKSCSGLTSYARRHAPRTVLPNMGGPVVTPMPREDRAEGSPQSSPAPAAGGTTGQDFSTTNVQEEGVDEPDTVKTDGQTLFTTSFRSLYAIDARAQQPRMLGSLDLGSGSGHQLLLHRNRLLVISQGAIPMDVFATPGTARAASVPLQPYRETTNLTEVDVSDPANMKIVRTLEVEGYHLSARLNGSTARLVFNTPPRALQFAPESGDTVREMRAQARRAKAGGWLPRARLTHKPTGRTLHRKVVACRSVRHASDFSGTDMLTVATIDLEKGLHIIDSDAVMTNADIVYGSTKNLYVATQRWLRPDADPARVANLNTLIHKFSLVDSENTRYDASGVVPGHLLSQWAMSEKDGNLRVASTSWPVWLGDRPEVESQSYVTVLGETAGKLVQKGQVGGLGKGERIYAVRFIDDIGYVVTFRQVDPLYTVDVSDPANPRVRGELKIEGYSAYLHPVGKDLLLGVGQDATEEGRRLGAQLSLFDVSDPAAPRRLHQTALEQGSSSSAEYDHHAFLWWPATKLAVVPVAVYGTDGRYYSGAHGFRVDRESGITEVGRIQHDDGVEYPIGIERSNVVGQRLFTLSMLGVKANHLDTFAEEGWLAFPRPAGMGHAQPADG